MCSLPPLNLTSGIEQSEIWHTGHGNTRYFSFLFFVRSLFTEKAFKKTENCQPNVVLLLFLFTIEFHFCDIFFTIYYSVAFYLCELLMTCASLD